MKSTGAGVIQLLLQDEKNPQTQAVKNKIKLRELSNKSDPGVPFAGTLLAPFLG